MNSPFPADVEQRVQSQLETGLYPTEEDVLRAAMSALERERDDLASIQAGSRIWKPIATGRLLRSTPSFVRNTTFRTRYDLPRDVDGSGSRRNGSRIFLVG